MKKIITNANGFEPIAALRKAATHPAVDEIEGGGCDDGRVFIHLKDGWMFEGYDSASASVGVDLDSEGATMKYAEISRENRENLAYKMSLVVRRPR